MPNYMEMWLKYIGVFMQHLTNSDDVIVAGSVSSEVIINSCGVIFQTILHFLETLGIYLMRGFDYYQLFTPSGSSIFVETLSQCFRH